MTALVTYTIVYLSLTIALGLYAARFVRTSKDYFVAGRQLPLYMNMATVFATWFGAETVLSVSATFAKDGLSGVPADPFGATSCLVIVALLFARAFYRMDLLTIGDFYRKRYGQRVEILTSVAVVFSYLGWTSAQLTALGIVFNSLSGGQVSIDAGIVIGTAIVLLYTVFGGMWSVALTDLLQSVVIVVGLLCVAAVATRMAGGFENVVAHAAHAGKLRLWPSGGAPEWLAFIAAWTTIALGSIPQQDVFQRVTTAKNERTAVTGTLLGGLAYFAMALVPMYLAYSALLVDPGMASTLLGGEGREVQLILPNLVLHHMPLAAQVVFFGALLSAVLSTASATLLAPAALLTENVIKPLFAPDLSDKRLLLLLRFVLGCLTLAVLVFALRNTSTMYQLVQDAYKVTLVAAFVPLACGIYWRRATTQGALTSACAGAGVWLGCEALAPGAALPPQIAGLAASLAGMLLGSAAPQVIADQRG
jgi:SSS family transporter